MSDGFGGGGGFGIGGSGKNFVDNYYTYKQTSGGGGLSGGSSGGSILSTIIIVFIIAIIINNIATALIVFLIIASLILIVFCTYKFYIMIRTKRSQASTNNDTTGNLAKQIDPITVFEIPNNQNYDNTYEQDNRVYTYFDQIKQRIEDYRTINPEWEGGKYLNFVYVAGTAYMINTKTADLNTKVGDKLYLKQSHYEAERIILTTKSGIPLGYIPKRNSTVPNALMNTGHELFARLYSKRYIDENLRIMIEIFVKKEGVND